MNNIKSFFPLFSFIKQPFVYLDSAASAQKPEVLMQVTNNFYAHEYAPVGRSMYSLAEQATKKVIDVRKKVADFIQADSQEIVFTKGATEGLNFIAFSWGLRHLKKGDEIVLTEMEHHANLLPWQEVAKMTGAVLRFISVTDQGILDLSTLDAIITVKTKIVSVIHVSNALGTRNDIEKIIKKAHAVGAKIMIDACQSIPHESINVKQLDPDFLVFSGHKLYGSTGVGVLFVNKRLHDELGPYQFGGGIVFDADFTQASWLKPPHRYEAGTLPIAQIIGLGAVIDFINEHISFNKLVAYEASLIKRAIEGLQPLPGIRLLGPLEQLKQTGHILSFVVEGVHSHDVAAYLDTYGIAVRAGHYCAQPLAKKLGIDGSIRISVAPYTTREDIDYFISIMHKFIKDKPFDI